MKSNLSITLFIISTKLFLSIYLCALMISSRRQLSFDADRPNRIIIIKIRIKNDKGD